jgi:hypothetical protein
MAERVNMNLKWDKVVDYFDNIYSKIYGDNIFFKKIRIYSFMRFMIRFLANVIIPAYYFLTRNNSIAKLRESKQVSNRIIVSLTTYPLRINKVWIVIESILRQSIKPDKIIIWLSKEQFSSLIQLPLRLLDQRDRGLEIRLVEGDIRSHKKYFYAIKEFPYDYILTIDDDIIYRTTMVEELYNYSLLYPKTVISQYSSKMMWSDGKLVQYSKWEREYVENHPNFNTFFGSGGGVLFPPHSLSTYVTNMTLFISLTPTADDVWLNAMCRLNRTMIATTNSRSLLLPIFFWEKDSLSNINVGSNQNDEQIISVREYFLISYSIDPFQEFQ